MATKRPPEQRSIHGTPGPSQVAAQPTGNEVFEPRTAKPATAPTALHLSDDATPEEQLTALQQMATEYYQKLSETAAHLSQQAAAVYDQGAGVVRGNPGRTVFTAFLAGAVLGFLTKRH